MTARRARLVGKHACGAIRASKATASSGFSYEDLTRRDKANLDIFWLKDDSLEDNANLPDPDALAAEIVENVEAALAQFAAIAGDLKA